MSTTTDMRRQFLKIAGLGVAADFSFLTQLPFVSAAEAKLAGKVVPLDESIEPLTQLIEDSPRAQLLERIGERIRKGTSYREVLTALLLAGVRNVQPRPSIGFKFHCVLVVNSCHLASLAGPDSDRWLPIFWALDYFKSSQADEAKRSGWRMKPVDESSVPTPANSRKMFTEAMNQWDAEKADAATAGLVRSVGATEVFNLFAQYAARDYRSIGHKAIYLANAWRTLQVIGWKHAEPVLRSLSFALLNHNGQSNPAKSDHAADRPWRENSSKLERISAAWLDGKLDARATSELFPAFREGTPSATANVAVDLLGKGVSPQSIWDGVFVGAGELLMRQPGIIGLHGLTTANAMHYLYRNVADDQLRKRLLLQSCSFQPMFLESAKGRGKISSARIESLKVTPSNIKGTDAIAELLAVVSKDRMQAAEKLHGFLKAGGNAHAFVDAARRLLFTKGRNAHDYKFSSAVLEDYAHVSPAWREQFLSTSVFNLKGAGDRDSGLLDRTRSALARTG